MDKQCFIKSVKEDYSLLGKLLVGIIACVVIIYALSLNASQINEFVSTHITGYNIYLSFLIGFSVAWIALVAYLDPSVENEKRYISFTEVSGMYGGIIGIAWLIYVVVAVMVGYDSWGILETITIILVTLFAIPIALAYAKCKER
jgi:hypothetical protein